MSGNRRSPTVRTWARALVEDNPGVEPLDLVTRVADCVAHSLDGERPAGAPDDDPGPAPGGQEDFATPPGGWADPWLVGVLHEQAVTAEDRSARGAWYTPESVVRGLVELAWAAAAPAPTFAADPTCGGGAFLLACLDRFVAAGMEPAEALTRVAGLDIDPGAVQVSRRAVELWARAKGIDNHDGSDNVSLGDALAGYPGRWPADALIVGNPPFATPLRTGAVPQEVAAFRTGREELLGPYTDLAAMHLLAAVERCGPGAVVALVQPQSILAGRDSASLRTHCDRVAPLQAMWAARELVFDAGVRTCAAVLRPGGARPERVQLATGPDVRPTSMVAAADPEERTAWSSYAARSLGAPELPAAMDRPTGPGLQLGDLLSSATAGFRDEYYGLVAACKEWDGPVGEEPNRLVTVGAVEPLGNRWGTDGCRFGGKKWTRPCIDVTSLEGKVRTWTERRLTPKVVLATQSKLLEPLVDRDGILVPATPLLSLHAEPDDLNLVAAVLLAPPVVAWAWQRWFGSALAVDALKLAARQVTELPLPPDRAAWERAAALIASAEPDSVAAGWAVSFQVAATMNQAYRADDSVLAWWMERAKAH